MSEEGIKRRGFGSMEKPQMKAIAAMGGRAAHAMGKAHQWTPEAARAAAMKGVQARAARRAAQVAEKARD